MIFLQEFLEKVDFEKNQQTTKKHEKFPKGQRVKATYIMSYCLCTYKSMIYGINLLFPPEGMVAYSSYLVSSAVQLSVCSVYLVRANIQQLLTVFQRHLMGQGTFSIKT